MWVIEHHGLRGVYTGMLHAPASFDGYAKEARKQRDDMPLMLVNAGTYVNSVFNTIQDPTMCMTRLEDMTFPYVLYLLFAAGGQKEIVSQYFDATAEQLRRYPGMLEALPESFKEAGEEVMHAGLE